ncbi:FAD synthetase family protein [Sedimentibacter sp. MB31-C6]|uniref:FAD synthetase family protein n=1 Tax=Sedimentibacter sp. MB31-C6 TaxID=3109366 RepID=UPI002DDD465E|nr:FAD synthetase family protein [Sedimentibacter sp. MB36-C1]WSI04260.1 FAD synthetase family protein [Sedimentibacter sp. MB36-C1]
MIKNNASCVALGNFDGIHIGHDILIKRMIEKSHETNQDSIIITFKYVKKDLKKSSFNIRYINNTKKKIDMLKSYGVTNVVEIELDEVISKYSPEQFIKEILIGRFNAKNIVVGYNFTFGYKAMGNIKTLKKFEDIYGYRVEEIYPVKYNGIAVSSTLVRNLIREGKIREGNTLLINDYTIYSEDIIINNNKKVGFVNNNSSIVVPIEGKYKVRIGEDEAIATIITNKEGSVFTFNKEINASKDIIFLDKII